MIRTFVLGVALLSALHARLYAQSPVDPAAALLDSLLRAHRYDLSLDRGELAGAGASFLRQATRGAQFVVLGEGHNNADIPQYTSALFRQLARDERFEYLVVESGPAMVAPAARAADSGGLPALQALVRRYPNGLQFVADQELEMFADVVKASRARGLKIWGVDQEFGGLHSLDRLRQIAPNDAARQLVSRVADRARPFDQARYTDGTLRYISRKAEMADFDSLWVAFKPAPASEAARLIEGLRTSHRIYQNNIHAAARMSGYISNHEREELMKTLFLDYYDEARRAGTPLPRALVKMGHYHVIRGRNWGNQYSLGDMLVNLARANGQGAFAIGAYANNQSGDYGILATNADYGVFATAATPGRVAIIDVRPLRAFAHAGRIKLTPEQARAVFGFDALLFIGNTTRATFATIGR